MPIASKEMISQGCSAYGEQEPAGGGAERLTDLLTRRCGTGETARDVGDSHYAGSLVSETHRDARDGGDMHRSAHNPATCGGLHSRSYTVPS